MRSLSDILIAVLLNLCETDRSSFIGSYHAAEDLRSCHSVYLLDDINSRHHAPRFSDLSESPKSSSESVARLRQFGASRIHQRHPITDELVCRFRGYQRLNQLDSRFPWSISHRKLVGYLKRRHLYRRMVSLRYLFRRSACQSGLSRRGSGKRMSGDLLGDEGAQRLDQMCWRLRRAQRTDEIRPHDWENRVFV